MAYDPILAERIRAELARHVEFTEKKMFGGLTFLVNGKMCCGVTGIDLVLRLSPEEAERALSKPHTRPMDFTGKPMKSMVYVSADGTRSQESLRRLVQAAVEIATRLSPIVRSKSRRGGGGTMSRGSAIT